MLAAEHFEIQVQELGNGAILFKRLLHKNQPFTSQNLLPDLKLLQKIFPTILDIKNFQKNDYDEK